MVTSRGITLLAAAVLAWLAGRTLGIGELYAVAVAAAAVVGLGVLYVRLTTSSVSARRQVATQRVVAGANLDALVELRNDARLPSPTLLISENLPGAMAAAGHTERGEARFVVGGLGPGRVASARYTAIATTRGRYQLGPVKVRVRDPFGVAERTRRYTQTHDVLVYPRIEPLPAAPVRGAHMGSGSSDTRRVFSTGDDFYTMREYVNGDDLRRVHWPSTAHRQTLMVRQMEQPWQAHATVYLDARRVAHGTGPTGTLEKAVSVAASMVYHLADAGYAMRLVTDGTAGRIGPQSWESALDKLAILEPSENAGLAPSVAAARGGEGLFVGILGVPSGREDLASHPDMRSLFGVRGFGQRMALVVSQSGDPRGSLMAALLRGAGWQATTVAPSQPLTAAWQELTRPAIRRGAAV
ncbi:MAG: DUF58 domain-containing protein [Euzebya sp.]